MESDETLSSSETTGNEEIEHVLTSLTPPSSNANKINTVASNNEAQSRAHEKQVRCNRVVSDDDVELVENVVPQVIVLDDDDDNNEDADFDDVPVEVEINELIDANDFVHDNTFDMKDEEECVTLSPEQVLPAASNENEFSAALIDPGDPMDLLIPLRHSSAERDSISSDDYGGSDDETNSVFGNTDRLSKEEKWQLWMMKFQWLLHEETEGDFAYCLYCDVKLNVPSGKYVKQHNISLYHRERTESYLAFKESIAQCNPDIIQVKTEEDTNDRVAQLKRQRAEEAIALCNFKWMRWMRMHPWLVREHDDGTIGLCKYCKVRLNVEFTYLRKRHEDSNRHRSAERSFYQQDTKRRSLNGAYSDDNLHNNKKENKMVCYELIAGSNPPLIYCFPCRLTITKYKFARHLLSKNHLSNVQKEPLIKLEGNHPFKIYEKQHPWITVDPYDPKMAFCKICSKRFSYGHSEIKRKVHENSTCHKQLLNAKNCALNVNNELDSKPDCQGDNELVSRRPFDDFSANEVDQDQKYINKSRYRSDAWFLNKDFPWCKRYPEDPNFMKCIYCNIVMSVSVARSKHQKTKRHRLGEAAFGRKKNIKTIHHFPWLSYSKNKKMQFCKFCRVRFPNEQSKARHAISMKHKAVLKKYMEQQAINKNTEQETQEPSLDATSYTANSMLEKDLNEKEPVKNVDTPEFEPLNVPMAAKVIQLTQRYPWISYNRGETRPNYCWCSICEVSFYMPSIKYISKHQRSGNHIRKRVQVRKRLMNSELPEVKETSKDEKKIKETIESLQEQYPWLLPDPNSENHCFCKICNARLPIKPLYRRQHDRSRRHIENMRLQNEPPEDNIKVFAPHTRTTNETLPNAVNKKNQSDSADNLSHTSTGGLRTRSLKQSEAEESIEFEPPAKRSRPAYSERSSHQSLIQAVERLTNKPENLDVPLALAEGILSNSFNIAACLAPILPQLQQAAQQQQQKHNHNQTLPFSNAESSTTDDRSSRRCFERNSSTTYASRNNNSLFFESIYETVMSLPTDLAAECKLKVMQVVVDCEMRAMRRKEMNTQVNINGNDDTVKDSATPAPHAQITTVRETESSTLLDSNGSQSRNGLENPIQLNALPLMETNVINNDAEHATVNDINCNAYATMSNSIANHTNNHTNNHDKNMTTVQSKHQMNQQDQHQHQHQSQSELFNNNNEATSTIQNNNSPKRAKLNTATKTGAIASSVQTSHTESTGTLRCVPFNSLAHPSNTNQQQPRTSLTINNSSTINQQHLSPATPIEHNGSNNTINNISELRKIRFTSSSQTKYLNFNSSPSILSQALTAGMQKNVSKDISNQPSPVSGPHMSASSNSTSVPTSNHITQQMRLNNNSMQMRPTTK